MAAKLTRATSSELRRMRSRTDLARVDADERQGKPAILDGDDTPLTAGELASAKRLRGQRGKHRTPTKEAINLRVDRSVVDSFRSMGAGWRTMMNDVLRQHVESRKSAKRSAGRGGGPHGGEPQAELTDPLQQLHDERGRRAGGQRTAAAFLRRRDEGIGAPPARSEPGV